MPVSLRAASCIGLQACRGVLAYHDAGYVMRDVKPSNIVLRTRVSALNDITEGNEIVLVDGGLAAPFRSWHRPSLPCSEITGTVAFMACEQLRPGRLSYYCLNPLIDCVGLGRSLLLTYCNGLPFDGLEEDDIIAAVRDGTLMGTLFPRCSLPSPAPFTNVALWLCEDDPDCRLTIRHAMSIFEYMGHQAAAGEQVDIADIKTKFGVAAHRWLELYPIVETSGPATIWTQNVSSKSPDHSNSTVSYGLNGGQNGAEDTGCRRTAVSGQEEAAIECMPNTDMVLRTNLSASSLITPADGTSVDKNADGASTAQGASSSMGISPRISAWGQRITLSSVSARIRWRSGRTAEPCFHGQGAQPRTRCGLFGRSSAGWGPARARLSTCCSASSGAEQ
eukprot:jgi/Ulvmu1/7384/UM036_0044.1